MAITTLHKRKFKTNLAILFAVLAWCALLFAVAITRVETNALMSPVYNATKDCGKNDCTTEPNTSAHH